MTAAPPLAAGAGPAAAGRLALLALLLGACGIAFAPIFVRVSELGPATTALWRVALALPVLWLWAAAGPARHARRPNRREKLLLMLAGLFFAGDLAAWHLSIHWTSVANATLLANAAPIFVTLGAWLLWRERPTGRFLAGLAVALAGAALLLGDSHALGGRNLLGDGFGLLTAVFYGAYILSVRRLRDRFSTATLMAWSGLGTFLGLLPVALLSGEPLLAYTAAGWAVLTGVALVSHCFGQGLIAYALAHLPAPFTSVSLMLQPALAALLAWLLLGEAMGAVQAAGAAVILAGILLARQGSAA